MKDLAPPILYTQRTTLKLQPTQEPNASPLEDVIKLWIEFVWRQGGGLPLPPPYVYMSRHKEENSLPSFPLLTRIIIPPFIKERIVAIRKCAFPNDINDDDDNDDDGNKNENTTETKGGCCEILYTVDNPGIATYQVHTHMGRVRFVCENDRGDTVNDDNQDNQKIDETNKYGKTVEMIWQVEIRPIKYCGCYVKTITQATISNFARNFKVHVEEGADATVNVCPSRGGDVDLSSVGDDTSDNNNNNIINNRKKKKANIFLGRVRKDSCLGGILDTSVDDDDGNDNGSKWKWTVGSLS